MPRRPTHYAKSESTVRSAEFLVDEHGQPIGAVVLEDSAFADHAVIVYVGIDPAVVVGVCVVPQSFVPLLLAKFRGEPGEVPVIGPAPSVGARKLAGFRLGAAEDTARAALERVYEEYREILEGEPVPFALDVDAPKRGRPGRTDVEYARTADAYATGLNEGRKVSEVASACGLDPHQLQHHLRQARSRGLLTAAPGRGRSGGSLTPKGRAILSAAPKVKSGATQTRSAQMYPDTRNGRE
jgi:hypothetical protein